MNILLLLRTVSLKLAAITVPLLALVIGVNVYIDPANLLHDVSRSVVQELLQRRHVALLKTNIGFGEIRHTFVAMSSEKADIAVIGSSRSLQIRSWMLPREAIFHNLSIPNSQIETHEALYDSLKRHNYLPKTVILCVDHWLFETIQAQNIAAAAQAHSGETSMFRLSALAEKIIPKQWLEVVSLSYFQSSLAFWRTNKSPKQFYTTLDTNDANMLILRDGGVQYSADIRHRTVEEVRNIVVMDLRRNNNKKAGDAAKFEERGINTERKERFEAFVRRLRGDGVRCVMFLSPYHPLFYENLKSLPAVEAAFREIAQRNGLDVIGSYDPAALGMDETDFFDYWHPTPECLAKLFGQERVRALFTTTTITKTTTP